MREQLSEMESADSLDHGRVVFRSIRTGERTEDIKKGFASACREAGLDNLTFHDLRHT